MCEQTFQSSIHLRLDEFQIDRRISFPIHVNMHVKNYAPRNNYYTTEVRHESKIMLRDVQGEASPRFASSKFHRAMLPVARRESS
jgi:hypothetical protein